MRVISEAKFDPRLLESYPDYTEEIINKQLVTILAKEILKHVTVEKDYSHPQEVKYTARAFFLTEKEHEEYQKLKYRSYETKM